MCIRNADYTIPDSQITRSLSSSSTPSLPSNDVVLMIEDQHNDNATSTGRHRSIQSTEHHNTTNDTNVSTTIMTDTNQAYQSQSASKILTSEKTRSNNNNTHKQLVTTNKRVYESISHGPLFSF